LADGRRVAGEFGVAATGEGFSVPSAGEAAGAFPVADIGGSFQTEFLIEKEGLNFSCNLEGGDGDFPARRIGGAAGGFPLVEWYDDEVGRLEWGGGAFGGDPGS